MKRLSFFALTSLVLAGACFDIQASESKITRFQSGSFIQEISDLDAFVFAAENRLAIVPYIDSRPFLKRHEIAIKRAGAFFGGVAVVAGVVYAIKNPKETKEKLQAAGSKAVEVGGKVTGVVAQGAGKLVNGAGIALNAAKDRMPSASTVVNAVRNRMPSSSSLPSLSSLNPFKK